MRGTGSKRATELRAEIGDERGPNGRPLCTWCRGEVGKGRRTWCSEACVHAYRIRNDWNYMKAAVFKRDRGICCLCLADTQDQRRMLKRAKRQGADAVARLAEKWGIPMHRVRGQLWDADHIIPCVEGGEDHPSNLRTLCLRCHSARTQELRDRRKALHRSAAG